MFPDRVSNPGPLIYESGVLPIALRGPAEIGQYSVAKMSEANTLKASLVFFNKNIIVFEYLVIKHLMS